MSEERKNATTTTLTPEERAQFETVAERLIAGRLTEEQVAEHLGADGLKVVMGMVEERKNATTTTTGIAALLSEAQPTAVLQVGRKQRDGSQSHFCDIDLPGVKLGRSSWVRFEVVAELLRGLDPATDNVLRSVVRKILTDCEHTI